VKGKGKEEERRAGREKKGRGREWTPLQGLNEMTPLGGIFSDGDTTNFLLIRTVKEFRKSVYI